jgi:hypothetical protein
VLALLLFGTSGVLLYGFLAVYLLWAAGVPPRRTLAILGTYALAFLPVAVAMLLLKAVGAPLWLEVGLPAVLVLAYLAWTFRGEMRLQAVLQQGRRWLRQHLSRRHAAA